MMRLLLLFLLFFLSLNTSAIELRYDGIICNNVVPPETIISRFIVLESIGNLYTVRVEGGLPSLDVTAPQCIDNFFRHGGVDAGGLPQDLEGHAIYFYPYLFLVVNGAQADNPFRPDGRVGKWQFSLTHMFTFIFNEISFVLLQEDWTGTTYEGEVRSGTRVYDSPQKIEYILSY